MLPRLASNLLQPPCLSNPNSRITVVSNLGTRFHHKGHVLLQVAGSAVPSVTQLSDLYSEMLASFPPYLQLLEMGTGTNQTNTTQLLTNSKERLTVLEFLASRMSCSAAFKSS